MAAGWSVMDAINRNSKAAAEDRPKARFRTRDISVKKMYSNDMNFYSRQDIEELSNLILAVGLIENMAVTYDPCEKGEYRIISGEMRWRALNLLLEKRVFRVRGGNVSDSDTCRRTRGDGADHRCELIQNEEHQRSA